MSRPVETKAPRLEEESHNTSKIGEDDSMMPLKDFKEGSFQFDFGMLGLSSEHS